MLARNGAGLVFTSGVEVIMGLKRLADHSTMHTDPEKGQERHIGGPTPSHPQAEACRAKGSPRQGPSPGRMKRWGRNLAESPLHPAAQMP